MVEDLPATVIDYRSPTDRSRPGKGEKAAQWCLVAGGLPLLIYPFVALADLMALAAKRPGEAVPVGLYLFLFGSLAYPVVFFVCLGSAWLAAKTKRDRTARCFHIVPIVYLLALIVLMLNDMRS